LRGQQLEDIDAIRSEGVCRQVVLKIQKANHLSLPKYWEGKYGSNIRSISPEVKFMPVGTVGSGIVQIDGGTGPHRIRQQSLGNDRFLRLRLEQLHGNHLLIGRRLRLYAKALTARHDEKPAARSSMLKHNLEQRRHQLL
jgi:hypothetical protein